MEAVILIGIQGAGKSTFYRERFFDTHVRVSLDMLKTRHRERALLEACLATGQPLVVDNTNVTAAERARYIPRPSSGRSRTGGGRRRPPRANSRLRPRVGCEVSAQTQGLLRTRGRMYAGRAYSRT